MAFGVREMDYSNKNRETLAWQAGMSVLELAILPRESLPMSPPKTMGR